MKIFKIKLININDNLIKSFNSFLNKEKIKFVESNENFDIVMFGSFPDFKILNKYEDKKKICISGENLIVKINVVHIINKIFKNISSLRDSLLYFFIKFEIKNFNLPFYIYKKNIDYIRKSKNSIVITDNLIEWNSINIPSTFIYDYSSLLRIDKKLRRNKKKKFCAFIVSNPSNLDRLIFYKKLLKYKKIDSYGNVFNNCKISNKLERKYGNDFNKINQEIYKDYKFVICFENSYAQNYITEKIINPMISNSIPIYRGASNVRDYFNTSSFINYDNYSSYEEMIKKIVELDNDDEKYEEFLKQNFLRKNFFEKINNERKKLVEALLK